MNRRELLASTAALALIPAEVSARFYGTASTAVVSPSGAITTFRIKNTSGGLLVKPRISVAQPFATGDLPSGSHLELRANDGVTVIASQQDQESTWSQDGSYKVVAISFVSPDTFALDQVISYQIWPKSGAPNRNPGVSLANVAANSDIKARFTGQTLGTDMFEVGINDIIANGKNWPWGANPMRGWEIVRIGPVCCEWRFWSYLRRTSDGAFHKWLKGWVYVRAWGPTGPFEIAWGIRASNIITTNGMIGGKSNDTNVFDTVLLNGATTLQAWGGSGDPRVVGVPSSLFNTTTKTVAMPTNSIFGGFAGVPGGVPITFSGSVGTGIDTSAVYWMGPYIGNPAQTGFGIARSDAVAMVNTGAPGGKPWAGMTNYNLYDYVTNGGNILYRCITPGTSAASGGPTGNGTNITDGTVHWTCAIAAFTTQGSGTITITPHCQCFPFTGQVYLDQNAHRLWSGATRPDYEMAHDFTYLTTKSKAVPPYISTVSPTADTIRWTHSPGNQYFLWDISSGGNPPGDDRVGWLMSHEAKLLYLPFDVTQHQNCRVIALTFAEQHIYLEDESVGKIPVMNNGHLRDGISYPNLGICRPTARGGAFGTEPSFNSPLWLDRGGDGIIERYNVFMDSSHGPMPGYLSYLKTGDDLYREYMLHLGNMNVANNAGYINGFAIGSITYWRVAVDPTQQARGVGWGIRWFGNIRHLMPETDPVLSYWTDVLNEQALFMEAWRQNVSGVSNPAGMYPGLVGPIAVEIPFGIYTFQPPTPVFWHNDIQFFCMAMEAWRGEIPEWGSFLTNYLKNMAIDRVDESSPMHGCMWAASTTYQVIWADFPTSSVWPTDWDGAWANVSKYWHFNISPALMPYPWACPSSEMFDVACCGGAPIDQPNSYVNFNTACQAMWSILAPSGHGAALYTQARKIQYTHSPPLSFNIDPTWAIGPIGATG